MGDQGQDLPQGQGQSDAEENIDIADSMQEILPSEDEALDSSTDVTTGITAEAVNLDTLLSTRVSDDDGFRKRQILANN